LIAAGLHPTPFGPSTSSTSLTTSPLGTDNADVVMTTTHKILRGPRGALIFSRKSEYRNPTVQHRSGRLEQSRLSTSLKTTMSPSNGREAKSELISKSNRQLPELIDRAIFPGIQGGPHMNTIAAIGVCLEEALQEHYRLYVIMVQQNAKKLADELIKNGLEIITGGTDNHLFLVDLRPLKLTGQEAQDRLEKAGITVNKNAIPYDQASPMNPSGIRIGTPAITTQGMKPTNMPKLAQQIADRLKS
jgi:glycine/serine hydroxymethyltransferase